MRSGRRETRGLEPAERMRRMRRRSKCDTDDAASPNPTNSSSSAASIPSPALFVVLRPAVVAAVVCARWIEWIQLVRVDPVGLSRSERSGRALIDSWEWGIPFPPYQSSNTPLPSRSPPFLSYPAFRNGKLDSRASSPSSPLPSSISPLFSSRALPLSIHCPNWNISLMSSIFVLAWLRRRWCRKNERNTENQREQKSRLQSQVTHPSQKRRI